MDDWRIARDDGLDGRGPRRNRAGMTRHGTRSAPYGRAGRFSLEGTMTNRTTWTIALAFAAAVAACGRSDNRAADTTLNRDLSLAAQANQPLDSLSAAERVPQANALNAPVGALNAATLPRHTTTRVARRSAGGGEIVRTSSGATRTTSGGTVVKHTKRDAAIGAAAGAVIGATTSRNKVKGGIIGAAVGGILGGIIGNNVDKTKKP